MLNGWQSAQRVSQGKLESPEKRQQRKVCQQTEIRCREIIYKKIKYKTH